MNVVYDKTNGLVPAIIQDASTKNVLMLGYMNEAAYAQTVDSGQVCFYSRSKQRLWTKGETSGNYLSVVDIKNDCDDDTLLISVKPNGPTCHTGADTCWGQDNFRKNTQFLQKLEEVIDNRKINPSEQSYVASLFRKGINKIAQKVGEEAVELVIEAKDDNIDLFKEEAADLLFHYLILLNAKGVNLNEVIDILEGRQK